MGSNNATGEIMASRRIAIWCAGVVLIGGAFSWGLGGNQTLAADAPGVNGELQPIPSQSAQIPPGDSSPLQPYGGVEEAVPGDPCAILDDDCEGIDFCGFACCCPPGKLWLRADYLMWWTNGMKLPALVTTSPIGTPVDDAGVLPNATILYGNDTVATSGRSGFKLSWGMWLDNCCTWGIEGDYFALGEGKSNFNQYSTGDPILTRPLYDVENIEQSRELVSYPDVIEGTISVNAKDYFQSTGVVLSYNLCCNEDCCCCGCNCDCGCDCDPCMETCLPLMFCCRTDLLIGYRYYKYSDSVAVRENLRVTESGPLQDWLFQVDDSFRARNDFHGSEIGLRTRLYRGRWSLEVLTKVALGNTHQIVTIDGQTIVTPTGQATQIRDGGVFAVRTNEGTYTRDSFTMIPQVGVELGYQVNDSWRAFLGYNVLYWATVIHAAEQIDLNIDPRNIPIAQDPALPFPRVPRQDVQLLGARIEFGPGVPLLSVTICRGILV